MRFLLVDRIEEVVPGASARGWKNAAMSEDYFEWHFPERPIVPGMLVLESFAQLAGWVEAASSDFERWFLLDRVKAARYYAFAGPGDRIDLTLETCSPATTPSGASSGARAGGRRAQRRRGVRGRVVPARRPRERGARAPDLRGAPRRGPAEMRRGRRRDAVASRAWGWSRDSASASRRTARRCAPAAPRSGRGRRRGADEPRRPRRRAPAPDRGARVPRGAAQVPERQRPARGRGRERGLSRRRLARRTIPSPSVGDSGCRRWTPGTGRASSCATGVAAATEDFTRPLEAEALNASCSATREAVLHPRQPQEQRVLLPREPVRPPGGQHGHRRLRRPDARPARPGAARALRRGRPRPRPGDGRGPHHRPTSRGTTSCCTVSCVAPTSPATGRSTRTACGLVPGEAAAALTLEPRGRSARRPSRRCSASAPPRARRSTASSPRRLRPSRRPSCSRSRTPRCAPATWRRRAARLRPARRSDGALLAALASVPALDGVPAVSWRGAVGHTALAGDAVDLVVAADGLRDGLACPAPWGCAPRSPTRATDRRRAGPGRAARRRAARLGGPRGQASALVLGRG